MQPARKTTSRRAAAMRWLARGGPLPTSAMASAESPVPPKTSAPTETSLRVAQRMVGGLPRLSDSAARVRRLAAKLDRLKKLANSTAAGKQDG